ncbi:transposase, partial [bacterium]|nr:transposase [bacterium]
MTDNSRCREEFYMERWPDGHRCPDCGRPGIIHESRPDLRTVWFCKACRTGFTLFKGTSLHFGRIPLYRWMLAAYLVHTTMRSGSPPATRRFSWELEVHYTAALRM